MKSTLFQSQITININSRGRGRSTGELFWAEIRVTITPLFQSFLSFFQYPESNKRELPLLSPVLPCARITPLDRRRICYITAASPLSPDRRRVMLHFSDEIEGSRFGKHLRSEEHLEQTLNSSATLESEVF